MTTATAESQLEVPAWVGELDPSLFRVVSLRIRGAGRLRPGQLERRVTEAYEKIAGRLDAAPRRYPVRFWNYIPSIHHPAGPKVDRYMVFNAGRFAACRRWLEDAGGFERHLPTASAVGHDGEDLMIHALGAARKGVAVENPLQVPAYRYSARYGVRPPCFARAMLLGDLLLVGGTASIVGEDSTGAGDLEAQFRQTLINLESLICAGLGGEGLKRLNDARVYFARARDEAKIRRMVGAVLGGRGRIEYLRADLCRRELLVEIEGIAR